MDVFTFKASLKTSEPPADLSVYLLALWYEAQGNWNKAHEVIQDVTTANASWIHAYLHRKEGDAFNADYWYTKAGLKRPAVSLDEEWTDLVENFVNAK